MAHVIKPSISTSDRSITDDEGIIIPDSDLLSTLGDECIQIVNNDDPDTLIDNELSRLERNNAELEDKVLILERQLVDLEEENNTKVEESVQKGINLGVEKGHKEYLLSVEDKLKALDLLVNIIADKYEENLFDSTDDFIDIIFTSVTKIIAKEYSKDTILNMVNESIKNLLNSNVVKLHVSSDDADYFDGYEFSANMIDINIDSRINHGGCIIETTNEKLDCRLDKKIEIFKELLMDAKLYVS